MGMLKEFKDFALRGNVVDMAVGVVIGAAFGKIVSSLVSHVIMPPLGYLLGGIDFSNLFIPLSDTPVSTLAENLRISFKSEVFFCLSNSAAVKTLCVEQ